MKTPTPSLRRPATAAPMLGLRTGLILLIAQSLTSSAADRGLRFGRDILPILSDNCFECHGPDEKGRKAKLRLDTREGLFGMREYGPLIVPGKPEDGEFIQRITSKDTEEMMPPPEAHRRPTPAQIEKLRQWVSEGATYEAHWAFVPPRPVSAQNVSRGAWGRNELDRVVLAQLDELDLRPQPEAGPEVLARRLSLALTGLPLSIQATDRFVATHARDADAAVAALADELLASPAYGEHFAWSWMDAARYADSNGYQLDANRSMWRWRDWLIAALNRNQPFDQMTRDLLAGDLLIPASLLNWRSGDLLRDAAAGERVLATGFLRNHSYDTGSGAIAAETKFENAADRMETVGTVWMGLTLHCARCHDHKFDPLPTRDYYSMLAFFDKVPEFGMSLIGASHPYLRTPDAAGMSKVAEADARVKAAEKALERAEPRVASAQTRWEHGVAATGRPATPENTRPRFDLQRVTRGLRFHYAKEPLEFDGDMTKTEPADAPKLIESARAYAISFWFRQEGTGDAAIISSVNVPEGTWRGFTMDVVGGRLRLRLVYRWEHSHIEFISREPFQAGEWHHVTVVSNGLMQGVGFRAYVDGDAPAMECTHDAMNNNGAFDKKNTLVIGGGPFLPKFRGTVADLRFYDRELSASEVRLLADRRSVAELVAIPEARRNDEERAAIRHCFMDTGADEELKALQRAVHAEAMARDEFIKTLPTTMVMQEVAGGQTHVRLKGAYDQFGVPVNANVPVVLPPLPRDAAPDRVALANWLFSPQHPLTARVSVNRLWQQLWGRGFVDSPENFGTQCAQPEHAAALDWLAVEYRRLGWDTKALLKVIVTSATYRQSSGGSTDLWRRDPANRLLARGPRFRLPIGIVRDQALAISGLLKPEIGGPPVLLEPAKPRKGDDEDDDTGKSEQRVDTRRRTLYTFWRRNGPYPMLAVFDVADRSQCDVRVRRTNTPLQALVTLNEPGLADCARAFARRVRQHAGTDAAQLVFAFRSATGRAPVDDELRYLHDTLRAYRGHFELEAEAGAQLGGKDGDAAWTALANVLLNLDATLTLE
ncbi:MAG: DUF1553 domain-containing protein [Opitutus sp.]|nr:DUF1553 domain-containing protein [Opitutus sp.]